MSMNIKHITEGINKIGNTLKILTGGKKLTILFVRKLLSVLTKIIHNQIMFNFIIS